jgi:hypothetical protein
LQALQVYRVFKAFRVFREIRVLQVRLGLPVPKVVRVLLALLEVRAFKV